METKRILTHVNALRGLAILLVFLYHMQENWCPQGYLGVDAFFVISGYFLVQPLIRKTQEKRFSWKTYYSSKLLRIIPPLAIMVLCALAAAALLMLPEDLQKTAQTSLAVLTGLVNISFGQEAVDYFAADVKENIYLHTWYIAVLLQILLLAPLICVPLARLRSGWRWSILSLLALASACVFFQHWLPAAIQSALPSLLRDGGPLGSVYYMTAGRGWEILAGAFTALLPELQRPTTSNTPGSNPGTNIRQAKRIHTTALTCGILLLTIPAFWPEPSTSFALLAVAGTMLIIRYGGQSTLPQLLENRPLLWLGTISYSLYLAHWPVIALAHYMHIQEFTLTTSLTCTLIALLLAWSLYHGAEKRKPRPLLTLGLWLAAYSAGLTLTFTHKLNRQLHPAAQEIPTYGSLEYQDWTLAPRDSWQGNYPTILNAHAGHSGDRVMHPGDDLYGQPPILQIGHSTTDGKQPNFVLLGDSYANALFPGLDQIGRQEGWAGLYINFYLTPFWGRLNRENGNEDYFCTEEKAHALLDWLAANPHLRHIIIMQCWKWRFETAETWDGRTLKGRAGREFNAWALRQFCQKLKERGLTPILMFPTPEANVIPNTNIGQWMKRLQLWYHRPGTPLDIANTRANYDKKMGRICDLLRQLERDGLCTLLDPLPVLFNGDHFQPIENGHLIVWDHDHMTVYGACKLVSGLRTQLRQLLADNNSTPRPHTPGTPETSPANQPPQHTHNTTGSRPQPNSTPGIATGPSPQPRQPIPASP